MRRREFIAGLGSAAIWPLTALPQLSPLIIMLGNESRPARFGADLYWVFSQPNYVTELVTKPGIPVLIPPNAYALVHLFHPTWRNWLYGWPDQSRPKPIHCRACQRERCGSSMLLCWPPIFLKHSLELHIDPASQIAMSSHPLCAGHWSAENGRSADLSHELSAILA
jgi:hypothetical protein